MTPSDGLNILLAWVFFGILLAGLGWLWRRSGQDDALSSISRPDVDDAGSRPGTARAPVDGVGGLGVGGLGVRRRDVQGVDVRGVDVRGLGPSGAETGPSPAAPTRE